MGREGTENSDSPLPRSTWDPRPSLGCAAGILALALLPAPSLAASPFDITQSAPQSVAAASPAPDIAPGWRAQRDLHTGRLRRAWGPGLPLVDALPSKVGALNPRQSDIEIAARSFLAQYGADLALPIESLAFKAMHQSGSRTWLSFQQMHRGVEVEDATVELRLFNNRVVIFGGQTRPEARALKAIPTLEPKAALRAARIHLQDGIPGSPTLIFTPTGPRSLALAYRIEVTPNRPGPSEILYIDAHNGGLLKRRPGGHFVEGTALMEREARSAGDPILTQPFLFGTVIADEIELGTDADGRFDLGDPLPSLTLKMSGMYLEVTDGRTLDIPSFQATPGDPTWQGVEADLPALNTWAAFHEVHDWAKNVAPELPYLNQMERAQVNVQGDACNAYYQLGKGMFFFGGDENEGCVGFARIADVVYHEYGHGLHHALIQTGIFDDSISEGSADYIAGTINGDPIVGPGAYGPGTFIREMDSNRRYPSDLVDAVHTDGLIWAGAMWDLRSALKELEGEAGITLADTLFVTALRGGPGFQDVYSELLFADDDDGNLSNGTPHLCQIDQALGPHGLSAGGLGLIQFGHSPLRDQPLGGPFEVEARPEFDGDCPRGDTRTLSLFYRVDDGPWASVPMAEDAADPGRFVGAIPDVPPGGEVQYDIQLWDEAYNGVASLSGGRPDLAPSFYVGETETLWCDDFEGGLNWTTTVSGADESGWLLGAPQGLGGDPLGAVSGDMALGTRFGDQPESDSSPGLYRPGIRQSIISPNINTEGRRQVRLSYMRHLCVEDGAFDEARLSAQGATLWENLRTQGGSFHTKDRDWSRQTHRAWTLDGRSNAQFVFYLKSDEAIEMGGWTLDDVCVEAPSDLADRYRSQIDSVERREDGKVVVTGTAPWALPLESVTLYRRVGGPVEDALQATEVATRLRPEPGEPVTFVDDSPPTGDTVYYRFISFDGRYRFPEGQGDAGEDGILYETPATPEPTPSPTPIDATRDDGGCGGSDAWLFLFLGPLGWRRRS